MHVLFAKDQKAQLAGDLTMHALFTRDRNAQLAGVPDNENNSSFSLALLLEFIPYGMQGYMNKIPKSGPVDY